MKKKPAKKYVRRHEIPDGKESGVLVKTIRLAKILKNIAAGKQIDNASILGDRHDKLSKKIISIVKHLKDS